MNTTEDDLARRIATRLDDGLPGIREGVLNQLRSARQAALDRHKPARAWGWASAVATNGASGTAKLFAPRVAVPAALLFVVLGAALVWQYSVHQQYKQHAQQIDETAEIDATLLSSDLPINALLDKGFDSWLKRSP